MWFFWVLGAACLVVLIIAPVLDTELKHKRKADYSLGESYVNENPYDPGPF